MKHRLFRTTTSKGPPWQSVVRRITKDLHTGEMIEDLAANPSEQQFYCATILGGPEDIQTLLHYLMRPAAPRERSSEGMQSVYVSSVPMSQLWAADFDSSQWNHTPLVVSSFYLSQ